MSETQADPVAAYLAEVRERAEATHQGFSSNVTHYLQSQQDVPRLLAAVQAALRLHHRQDRPVRSWDLDLRCPIHAAGIAVPSFETIRDCPDCTYRDRYVCANRDCHDEDWPCAEYQAITRELLMRAETDAV